MLKVYTGYYGTSEMEHGLCACTVGAKARGLSPHTGAQTMLYLSPNPRAIAAAAADITSLLRKQFAVAY